MIIMYIKTVKFVEKYYLRHLLPNTLQEKTQSFNKESLCGEQPLYYMPGFMFYFFGSLFW